MKSLRMVISGLIIIVALIFWVGLSDADSAKMWPKKQGELCWDLVAPGGFPTTVTLAVMRTIKDHYIVHGTITELVNGVTYVRGINGNAEIVGNNVIIHGSTAVLYNNGELIGGVGHVELNLNTLIGKSWGISASVDTNNPAAPGEVKYDGEVFWNLTSCN